MIRSHILKFIIIFIVTARGCLFFPPAVHAAPPGLSEIIKANTGIRSLEAEITQHIHTPEHSGEVFKGKYTADDSGRFRIDYTSPSRQTVLNTPDSLYWYYPEEKLLYIFTGTRNDRAVPELDPLQEFREKESSGQFKSEYLGKHLYGFFIPAYHFTVKDMKNDLIFNIWIHAKKKVLLAKIITNSAGIEIMKELYSDYRKIKNIYFPGRIDVYARNNAGITRNITEYSNIRLNYAIPQSIFKIDFPHDVKKKYLE